MEEEQQCQKRLAATLLLHPGKEAGVWFGVGFCREMGDVPVDPCWLKGLTSGLVILCVGGASRGVFS